MKKTDMIRSDLERYIYDEVVPRYAEFDPAHREDHALTVIDGAMELLDNMSGWIDDNPGCDDFWRQDVDREILLTAAAFHDLGLVNGRHRHHLDSGEIIRADANLSEWFSPEQIEIAAQAAEDHRASGKYPPRSIYGMLVAEADRVIGRDVIILRTVQYGCQHYPEMDFDGHVERAVAHLHEKYGRNGYLKLWVPWSDNAARLSLLHELIDDEPALYETVRAVCHSCRK